MNLSQHIFFACTDNLLDTLRSNFLFFLSTQVATWNKFGEWYWAGENIPDIGKEEL